MRRIVVSAVGVLTVASLSLGAVDASPMAASAAEAQCGGVLAPTSASDSSGFCVIAERAIGHLDAGQAVTVAGNVKVDDSAVSTKVNQRALLNAQLKCYVDGDLTSAAFGTNAVRNIFTGMTASGVYPRAVLVAKSSGNYSCVLDARQYDVTAPAAAPRSWRIASSALTVSPAAHGVSSSGPNTWPWPATLSNLTASSEATGTGVSVAQLDAYPAAGTTSVDVTASVPLSTCAYNSPDTNACWPAGAAGPALDKTVPFKAIVRVFAAQRTSPSDASFCGTRLVQDYPLTIDERTHHYTATATLPLTLSAACTGRVTIKTELHDVSGRGYVGTPGPDPTTPGKGYQNAVGAVWN